MNFRVGQKWKLRDPSGREARKDPWVTIIEIGPNDMTVRHSNGSIWKVRADGTYHPPNGYDIALLRGYDLVFLEDNSESKIVCDCTTCTK